MDPVTVVIVLERSQLPVQVSDIPKQDLVEILTADGPDQPFDEGVRDRYLRYRFNLLDTQNSQVSPRSVQHKQEIISDFRPSDG